MKDIVIVRGGGDLATGTIYKLKKCGFKILIMECEKPSAIRRTVAFSDAVYEGKCQVEDMECTLVSTCEEALDLIDKGELPILVDPKGDSIAKIQPMAVVDAIIAKKNLGTNKDMAPITIALGPGFVAGCDCDAVIETMRGHNLARVIYEGSALPNTGIPGAIAGVSKERVIHGEAEGTFYGKAQIGDLVEQGQCIGVIQNEAKEYPVFATITGILRGLIRDGYPVTCGFKIADIDPRKTEQQNCFSISDKARSIAGGVVEALLYLKDKKGI